VLLCASLWVAIQTSFWERFRLSPNFRVSLSGTGGTSPGRAAD
jgi:hypothetical protein